MRILLADPDQALSASPGAPPWISASHQVRVARTGRQALEYLASWHPDVAVVGTRLPDVDSFELLRRIHATSETIVLLLADRNAEDELVLGLDAGAHGVVCKPTTEPVLHASIDAVLRRLDRSRSSALDQAVAFGRLTLDPTWHRASWEGRPLQLTRQQFVILCLLARSGGKLVSYRQLIQEISSSSSATTAPFSVQVARLVNHITRIRAKIAASGSTFDPIVAVRGRGYRLIP